MSYIIFCDQPRSLQSSEEFLKLKQANLLACKVKISGPLQFLTKQYGKDPNFLNKLSINLICKSENETAERKFPQNIHIQRYKKSK